MPRIKKSKSGHCGRKQKPEKEVEIIEEEVEMQEQAMEIEEQTQDESGQSESQDQIRVQEEEQDREQAQTEQQGFIEGQVPEEEEKNDFTVFQSHTPSTTPRKRRKTGKRNTPKKRKKQLIPYAFTEQQEMELAEWFRDQECLYNRRIKSYKNTAMKTRVIEEKAKEFDPECSVQQLTNFLKSMRTQYSRLTNPKSGKGTKDAPLSDRDQWILNTFRLFEGHIVRMKGRTLQTPQKQAASQPREVEYSSAEPDSESDELEDDIEDQIPQAADDTSTEHEAGTSYVKLSTVGKGKGKIKGKGKTSKVSSEDAMEKELLEKLLQRADEVKELRQSTIALASPPAKLTPHEEQVKGFVTYLTTQLHRVPPEGWFNFTVDTMKMVQSYINRGTSSHSLVPAPLAAPPLQPQHDESFHPPYPPSRRRFSSYGQMPPPSYPPATFPSRQQLPPPRMTAPPGSFNRYHAPSPPSPFMQQQNPGPSGFQRSSSGFTPQNSTNPLDNPQITPMSMLFSGGMTSPQMGGHDDVMESSPGDAAAAAAAPPTPTTNT